MRLLRFSSLLLGASAAIGLSGCGISGTLPPTPNSGALGTIHGSIMGGQQPVVGAHIYVLAVGTGGYGTASTSLLQSGATTTADGSSRYYTTSANDGYGSFSVTGLYNCTPGTQVYLYATGGDAGAGANSQIGLMAGLGQCPGSGTMATNVPFVTINEVTTIATAYALAGFATDPFTISSANTTLAKTGVANAMANVSNIVNIADGTAYTAPVSAPTGTVPRGKIYALANILAACINGTSSSVPCTTLLGAELSNGTTGTQPSDTAGAAINMAKYAWNYNSDVFALSTPTGPFQTAATTAADFGIEVSYPTGGSGGGGYMVVDASGNVFTSYPGTTQAIVELSPQGQLLQTIKANGFDSTTTFTPQQMTFDSAGNLWATGGGGGSVNSVIKFDASSFVPTSTTPLTYTTTSTTYTPKNGSTNTLNTPYSIAFDANGNGWVANNKLTGPVPPLVEITSAGTYLAGATVTPTVPAGLRSLLVTPTGDIVEAGSNTTNQLYYYPAGGTGSDISLGSTCVNGGSLFGQMAIDDSGNIWYSCAGGLFKIASGTLATTGYTAESSASLGWSIAVDSADHIFQSTGSTGINEYTRSTGALNTPGNAVGISYTTSGNANQIVIDQSGNVWYTATNGSKVEEMLGVAGPVAQPMNYSNYGVAP